MKAPKCRLCHKEHYGLCGLAGMMVEERKIIKDAVPVKRSPDGNSVLYGIEMDGPVSVLPSDPDEPKITEALTPAELNRRRVQKFRKELKADPERYAAYLESERALKKT